MERTKRKNVFRAELIIFLAVIAVSLLVLWIRWENSHATYKNYDIVVKKNVYCEKTQTGRVDLQIRRKGGKKAKLLQTQQELKQSQSFQIVEDSYKLGIIDDASAYDGNIYEQKNAGGTQYLTLYYVNHEASGRQGKMHLVMNDAKTGKELINIKTSPKVKKDARRYEYRGKDLYVSEEGILLDAGTDEEFYNSQAMTAGLMTVCWKNGKEKQIQFDPNADVSEYEAADIIVPKVTSTGEEKSEEIHCYYALELSDWENIREIKLGENVFAKAENLEKATDDLNKKKKKSKEEKAKEEAEKNAENQKKKEFYTTDMSLLNQPEDFHISDYYITNKVIAGNRYYVDENHVLWGQGMNYYAQLGINHPEDVGNWYHEEYMEPQTEEPGVKYKADAELALGEMEVTGSAHTGKEVKLWKIVYENGKQVSKDVINESTYSKADKTISVGIKTKNSSAAAVVKEAVSTQDKAKIQAAISEASSMESSPEQ